MQNITAVSPPAGQPFPLPVQSGQVHFNSLSPSLMRDFCTLTLPMQQKTACPPPSFASIMQNKGRQTGCISCAVRRYVPAAIRLLYFSYARTLHEIGANLYLRLNLLPILYRTHKFSHRHLPHLVLIHIDRSERRIRDGTE